MKGADERDPSIERLLRESLGTPPQRATDACLDAEAIAAWFDGGLSGRALEMAQSHVADCTRCQVIVGGIARSESRVPATPRRRWFAWLVPVGAATAAIGALVLWVVVPGGPRGKATPSQLETSAQSVQTTPPETSLPGAPPASPDSLDKEVESPASPAQEQAAQAAKDVPAAAPGVVPEARRDAARFEADQVAPAQPAPAQAPPPAAFEARQALRAPGNAAGNAAVTGTEIASPDPGIRWRTVGSALQHSTNGGTSWDPVTGVPVDTTAMLVAGAAPATTVCWVVGSGGVVLLSTDGRTFSRVPFPEMTDLSAIRAADGRSATVTAADGRVFSTTDAGATWVRR